MNFWENVRFELEYKNLSWKQVASKANISYTLLYKGMKLNSSPSLDIAIKIADALEVSVEYLATGKYIKRNPDCNSLSEKEYFFYQK